MAKRARVHRETAEYHLMMERMVTAYGKRVAAARNVAELAALEALRAHLTAVIDESARALHEPDDSGPGLSWTEIGAAVGITRQSARERFTRTQVA